MRQKRGGIYARRDNKTENRTQEPMQKNRVILLAVRIFLLVLLQVCAISRIGFFGAVPDILLSYLVVLSVTGGGVSRWRSISVSGIFAGFLADAVGGVGFSVLPLFYFLVGAFCPHLMRRNFSGIGEELLFTYILLVPMALLREGVTLLTVLLGNANGFSFLVCFRSVLLPEFFGTLLFALPVFFLFRGRD